MSQSNHIVLFDHKKDDFVADVAIVAKGMFPSSDYALQHLRRAKHVIACDGGVENLLHYSSIRPDLVIGDGDSFLHQEMAEDIKVMKWVDDEINDLTKAINYAEMQRWKKVVIIAATGLREDHTIANIFLLPSYYLRGLEVRMYSDYGLFIPAMGEAHIYLPKGTQLSFFSPTQTPLSATGVKFAFENRIFTELWQASLNEAIDEENGICINGKKPYIVYISREVKGKREQHHKDLKIVPDF